LHSLGVTKCYGQILKDVAKYQLYHEKKIDEFRNDSDFVMFVIDNIDYVIKTTLDRAGKISRTSRHDIARYAIKPRIIDDTKNRTPREADIEVNTYYHTDEDIFKLKNALVSLVVDISKKHLPALEKALKNVDVKPQIPFEEERRQKTEEISLSLMFKDEKSYDDLLDVLNDLTNILENWYDSPDFPSSFVCGDQLIVERIANLIRILDDDGEDVEQLSRLIPAATDWHTRLNYVDWIWMLLYKPNDVNKRILGSFGNMFRIQKPAYQRKEGF